MSDFRERLSQIRSRKDMVDTMAENAGLESQEEQMRRNRLRAEGIRSLQDLLRSLNDTYTPRLLDFGERVASLACREAVQELAQFGRRGKWYQKDIKGEISGTSIKLNTRYETTGEWGQFPKNEILLENGAVLTAGSYITNGQEVIFAGLTGQKLDSMITSYIRASDILAQISGLDVYMVDSRTSEVFKPKGNKASKPALDENELLYLAVTAIDTPDDIPSDMGKSQGVYTIAGRRASGENIGKYFTNQPTRYSGTWEKYSPYLKREEGKQFEPGILQLDYLVRMGQLGRDQAQIEVMKSTVRKGLFDIYEKHM